ncbi:replication protein A 70 kDa DNA-binding subunit B [Tanacetum coccineum]
MPTFIAGCINDLSAVKDTITLRFRILRPWMQPLYGKQHVKNLELIVLDEHATMRMTLVNLFKDRLKEGNVVTLEGYSLGEIQPKFGYVNETRLEQQLRLMLIHQEVKFKLRKSLAWDSAFFTSGGKEGRVELKKDAIDDNGSSIIELINKRSHGSTNLCVLSYPDDISYLVYGAMFFIVSYISKYVDCPDSKYIGDPKSAGISTYAKNPTYVDIYAWTSLFWNCISISHLDTKYDVEVSLEWEATCTMVMMLINKDVDVWYHWFRCGTCFSFDGFDDGRCMLNFEVYAGSSLMIMMMGLSITYGVF